MKPLLPGMPGSLELIVKTMLALKSRGKTVIAITHRMNASRAVDRGLLLDKEHIVTNGPHEEHISNQEVYAAFWKV